MYLYQVISVFGYWYFYYRVIIIDPGFLFIAGILGLLSLITNTHTVHVDVTHSFEIYEF